MNTKVNQEAIVLIGMSILPLYFLKVETDLDI